MIFTIFAKKNELKPKHQKLMHNNLLYAPREWWESTGKLDDEKKKSSCNLYASCQDRAERFDPKKRKKHHEMCRRG